MPPRHVDPEKAVLLELDQLQLSPERHARSALTIPLRRTLLAFFALVFGTAVVGGWSAFGKPADPATGRCEQFPPRAPPPHEAVDATREFVFGEYLNTSVRILQGLVQIEASSFDDNGPVGEDPRWDAFFEIAAYLERTFPLLHKNLVLKKINTHALLYTWVGSDPTLRPVVYMAHSDTVPVNPETVDEWTYPPYSGYYDGTHLWGRGSVDCRDTLAASMEAFELLLAKGFEPKRTFVLSFGFDEESKGTDGAGQLSKYIESAYGTDGVAFIVDEGGLGVGDMWGRGVAGVATGEKGYLDVEIALHTPGGHSSIPPDHTSIGILSSIITHLEDDPYAPFLSEASPILTMLQCAAELANVSSDFKKPVLSASKTGEKGEKGRQHLAHTYAGIGKAERYLVATSQAVDVISGGVKVNALPETALVKINYRVSVDSTPQFVKDKIIKHLLPVARRHDLALEAFGYFYGDHHSTATGGVLKASSNSELLPAPVTPTSDSAAWEVLSSTIQHVFIDKYPEGLVVSPCLMSGNGDTAFYWNVTKNIFRFSPSDPVSEELIHTVDEHLLFSDHIRAVWFYHELTRNADTASFEA